MPSLDVIIVNWNTGDLLRACLAALAESDQQGYCLGRVVIVDNASTDGSMEDIACQALPLIFIKNNHNSGFAAACNQGAAGSSADYLLFLNPDTKVFKDTLASSVRWMEAPENHDTGILGVQLLDEEGKVHRSCAKFLTPRYFIHRMSGLNYLFPERFPGVLCTGWDHGDSRQVDHVMGAYFFVRRGPFLQLDGFDPRFFLYLEDIDLSLRMSRAGWSSYYLASVQCYHAGCGSSRQAKASCLFYCLKSRMVYASKHFGRLDATTLVLGTALLEPISRFVHAFATGSWRQVQTVAWAYVLFWRELPRILNSNDRRIATFRPTSKSTRPNKITAAKIGNEAK